MFYPVRFLNRDVHRFVIEPNLLYLTKSFVNNGVIQKKTNDDRTTWIVQGNEKRTKNINKQFKSFERT